MSGARVIGEARLLLPSVFLPPGKEVMRRVALGSEGGTVQLALTWRPQVAGQGADELGGVPSQPLPLPRSPEYDAATRIQAVQRGNLNRDLVLRTR